MGADPSGCIVIEDSPAGVTGAVAASMRVIGFVGGGHITPSHVQRLRDAGATQIVDHWSNMAAAINA
jgi:beta-phosphoglucomutase-like phosphatase (HAD superfamily)